MKQQFELSERLEREKKNLEDLNEVEIGKLNEEFEEHRSILIAEHKKLVTRYYVGTNIEIRINKYYVTKII